jgi:hypothetical protein
MPLQTSLILGALPSAVACARLHARNVMYEWNLPSVADGTAMRALGLRYPAGLEGQGRLGRSPSGLVASCLATLVLQSLPIMLVKLS